MSEAVCGTHAHSDTEAVGTRLAALLVTSRSKHPNTHKLPSVSFLLWLFLTLTLVLTP